MNIALLSTCIQVFLSVFIIPAFIVFSLIPTYISNKSIAKSTTILRVYTVDNVLFTVNSSTSTRKRRATSTNITFPAPTASTVQSIQTSLNTQFGQSNAGVVVSSATFDASLTKMILGLKVTFLIDCSSCQASQKKIIQDTLNKLPGITVDIQYYSNCSSPAVSLGSVVLKVVRSGSFTIDTGIASSSSIVQQKDPCVSNTTTNISSTSSTTIRVSNVTIG